MADSKFSDIINASLEKVKEFSSSETVIGDPIAVGSTTIIPVSRITMGFASGGVDYAGKKSREAAPKPNNFGGGGGTGLSISPVGFLTVKADGSVEIVNINAPVGTVEQVADVIERAPEIVAKFKALFTKNKKDKAAKAEDATEAAGETLEINIDAE